MTKDATKPSDQVLAPAQPVAARRSRIAVVGSGIAGMSAAWLLSRAHDVVLYESVSLGGHSHTVDVATPDGSAIPVDMGFIVYNDLCYPNLSALFAHLRVPTQATEMSLAVSFDRGALEYGGDGLDTLFAQRRRLFDPRFWSMIRDLLRFYREAPRHLGRFADISIGDWLEREKYGAAFRDDHLLPMAAAIWSAPAAQLLAYPAEAFVAFCHNHGLLRLSDRPQWRTVTGGSRQYVQRLFADTPNPIERRGAATGIRRNGTTGHPGNTRRREVRDAAGATDQFDAVVIATHADEALALLEDPSDAERELLGVFRYALNSVVLHGDPAWMPHRRKIWSSWNYLGARKIDTQAGGEAGALARAAGPARAQLCVTYWMNRLQHLDPAHPLFVTLNPWAEPEAIHQRRTFSHPVFDQATAAAQTQLWSLQGVRDTWFCGAYFGAGFHEDGIQAGLAVAEQLGGVNRPWQVAAPSGRIHVHPRSRTRADVAEVAEVAGATGGNVSAAPWQSPAGVV